MKYDPEKHHRRSVRLKGYDYTQSGAYFVTVVTQARECLFGEIADGETRFKEAGRMVQTVWEELSTHYPSTETDAFVVMPNHIHGVVVLVGAGPRACPDVGAGNPERGQPQGVAPPLSLSDIMHRFKTLTTKQYADAVKQSGWTPFPGRLWQRHYYEHVIRDEESLNRVRQYLLDNPARWAFDHENPAATSLEPEDVWSG